MAERKTDDKAIGISFLVAGAGLIVVLGLTVGWVSAPSGLVLAIVGLVFLTKDEDAS